MNTNLTNKHWGETCGNQEQTSGKYKKVDN